MEKFRWIKTGKTQWRSISEELYSKINCCTKEELAVYLTSSIQVEREVARTRIGSLR